MGKLNERTLQMIEGYERMWRSGHTVAEIAEEYGISTATVYVHLSKIAERIGVPRKELLSAPHVEHLTYDRAFEPVKPIDATGFKQSVARTMAAMEAAIDEISVMVEVCEEEAYDGIK